MAGLSGLLAFYVAVFMYEDEEGAIQDRLERIWVSISNRQRESGERISALLTKIGELLDSFLNSVFGKRLFSFQAESVAMCYSVAGLFLVEPEEYTFRLNHDWTILVFFLFVYLGSLPAIVGYRKAAILVALPFILYSGLVISQLVTLLGPKHYRTTTLFL